MKISRTVLERRFFESNDDCNECQLNPKVIMPPFLLDPQRKKWRTGANNSSQKKGFTEPGSLTNTILTKVCVTQNSKQG